MDQNCRNKITRRSLLRAAGGLAGAMAWSNVARASRLIIVATSPGAPISRIEWIRYDTGRLDSVGTPITRCAVRLTTTAGDQGWADVEGWIAPDSGMSRTIESIVLGQDPANHELLWQQLYAQAVPLATLGAIDTALWDLRGRIANQPVCNLLGAERLRIGSYVSSGLDLGGSSEYAAFASTCQESGSQGVKIQSAAETPTQDIAIYAAVRDAVGADFPCFACGVAGYTLEEAVQVGQGLDDLEYAWFQSPMPEADAWVSTYTTLAASIETPLCGPVDGAGSYQARNTWLDRGACDIACIDVHHGGLTACIQLADICQSKGIPLELPNVGLDAYPHLQLAGARTEAVVPHLELLSLSREPRTEPGRLTPEPVFDDEGYIAVPQSPGMGLELDWKYIFTHRVA